MAISNTTTLLNQPHNLTTLADSVSLADYVITINTAADGLVGIFILVIAYSAVFFYANRQNFTIESCLGYASYVTFVIALLGRLLVRDGIPFIGTKVVLFLFLVSAIMVFIMYFQGDR